MIAINVQIDFADTAIVDEARLIAVIKSTLDACHIAHAELTVLITSDEVIQQLNYQYRQINAPTDVLSFEAQADEDEFILPPNFDEGPEIPYLGDIVISASIAIRQAWTAGHLPAEEVLLLAIHGTLHLVGFDHMVPDDKAEMWQKQTHILRINDLAHVKPTES